MKQHLTIFLLITLLTCSSCSIYSLDSDQQLVVPNRDETRDPQTIEVLETVTRPHKVIGTIVINTERNEDMDSIYWRMKKEASVMGGDAITNLRISPNKRIRANFTVDIITYE